MNIAIFEDLAVEKLAPITTSRPAYTISCGGFRLIDLAHLLIHNANIVSSARPHLRALVERDFNFATDLNPSHPKTLFINARLAPTVTNFQTLKLLMAEDQGIIHAEDRSVAAAVASTDSLTKVDWSKDDIPKIVKTTNLPSIEFKLDAFEYPHDVIRFHMQHCEQNLEFLLLQNQFGRLADGVFAAKQSPPQFIPRPFLTLLVVPSFSTRVSKSVRIAFSEAPFTSGPTKDQRTQFHQRRGLDLTHV